MHTLYSSRPYEKHLHPLRSAAVESVCFGNKTTALGCAHHGAPNGLIRPNWFCLSSRPCAPFCLLPCIAFFVPHQVFPLKLSFIFVDLLSPMPSSSACHLLFLHHCAPLLFLYPLAKCK